MRIQTDSLILVLQTVDEVRAAIASLESAAREQLSAEWLALFEAATDPDPWVHGFAAVHRESDAVVGSCGFKGPPRDGVVEIAYGVVSEYQGRGYATEAAEALTAYALTFPEVIVVRAHTLPESSASQRVLAKCGFRQVGETVDPDDGVVLRFERRRTATLYRPVGPAELELIAASGWTEFPPRLPEQPIFYPVLNEEYAAQIARRWNVPESGAGYVTAFEVDADYVAGFEERQVGGREHRELWIPAEELPTFNAHIVGVIRVVRSFGAGGA